MIGVIADDTTGANDIGVMFVNNNYSAKILFYKNDMEIDADTDVVIIDTDSRLDSPEDAYAKVHRSATLLKQRGCTLIYKKTCSVFRGNVGREFDAVMDAVGEERMIVSVAFPKNGRETIGGIHRVHGVLLEHSGFRDDPVHPMRRSDLVEILQSQTSRKVGLIPIDTVRQGAKALKEELGRLPKTIGYVIVDSAVQDDLRIVAEAVQHARLLGGSSAIAEELPEFWPTKAARRPNLAPIRTGGTVLVVSGSLTRETRAQTVRLAEADVPVVTIDSRCIYHEEHMKKQLQDAIAQATVLLKQGKDVLLMMDNEVAIVEETKRLGAVHGMNSLEVSKKVSSALADAAASIVNQAGIQRLVVAGGDTSGTVCRRLNIEGNYVVDEIEPGVPSGWAIGIPVLIVLKSGSFGQEDFLVKAVRHLKRMGCD